MPCKQYRPSGAARTTQVARNFFFSRDRTQGSARRAKSLRSAVFDWCFRSRMNMMEFKHRSQSNQASSSGKQKQARFEQRHDLGGGEMTALQKHVAFFDRDGDGMISPLDTWRGMRDLGYGWTLSLLATFVVHLFLSWPSNDTWIPRTLNININNINRCRHGSDSQVRRRDGNSSFPEMRQTVCLKPLARKISRAFQCIRS